MNHSKGQTSKIESLNVNLRRLKTSYDRLGEDIKDITDQIRELELSLSSDSPPEIKHKKKLTLKDYRDHIGDTVRILNPRPGEPRFGEVAEVGKLYVILELLNNKITRRIPKNLQLISK